MGGNWSRDKERASEFVSGKALNCAISYCTVVLFVSTIKYDAAVWLLKAKSQKLSVMIKLDTS